MSVMTRRPRTAYLLLTGATTLALSACSGGETDPRTQPPLVRVATAAPVTGGTREFTGIVSARVQSDLGFRVGGKVTQRLVDVGQSVRRGQLLMRIDPVDLTLAPAAQERAGRSEERRVGKECVRTCR